MDPISGRVNAIYRTSSETRVQNRVGKGRGTLENDRTIGNDRKRNDRKRKEEKSKSKLSAQNLWKNLGKTKDLDSVGCT